MDLGALGLRWRSTLYPQRRSEANVKPFHPSKAQPRSCYLCEGAPQSVAMTREKKVSVSKHSSGKMTNDIQPEMPPLRLPVVVLPLAATESN